MPVSEAMAMQNRGTALVAMIESPEAVRNSKHVGIAGVFDERLVRPYLDAGTRMILCGVDQSFMIDGARTRSGGLRGLAGQ